MLPFLCFIFHVFNPQKSVQLFGLEMAVGYWLLSLEFEVGTFDLHLHSLQTNKQNNRTTMKHSQNQNTYNVKILFHSGLRFL